jgi:NAD-dependent SIR2 family protein deacetylase
MQEICPGNFTPSPSHKFIKLLEDKGKLLRNYTQNIDTLEQVAGIERVVQCHGSFASASCVSCKNKVSFESIKSDIINQVRGRGLFHQRIFRFVKSVRGLSSLTLSSLVRNLVMSLKRAL